MVNNNPIQKPVIFAPVGLSSIMGNVITGFNIPIYQRLYAWNRKEIIKLLEDITEARAENSTKDYFIGNLTLNHNQHSNKLDIIDGQQRLTTLWLIGLVLKKTVTNAHYWNKFLENEYGITLRFTSREEDNQFLLNLLLKENIEDFDSLYKSNTNPMIIEAINVINAYFYNYKTTKNIEELSSYIYNKVKMAAVSLPDKIDLNKYFEDMNNRGLQLEPHHIVKARLLEQIEKDHQIIYAAVWDAVAQMDQFLEKGFNGTLKDNRRMLAQNSGNYFNPTIKEENQGSEKTISQIIEEEKNKPYQSKERPKSEQSETVISIVTFPEFLLHTLKLFTGDKTIAIDDKKLVNAFDVAGIIGVRAKQFIEKLLEVRIAFDNRFIKSVRSSKGTLWEIKTIDVTDSDFERKDESNRQLIQIQSMLYVSTTTNQWFTDALKFAITPDFNADSFVTFLEQIDQTIHDTLPVISNLNRGTGVDRYWFYKLDYLLWKKWRIGEHPQLEGINKWHVENFQFRDNRSVEHIHPQNPEIETWQPEKKELLPQIKNQFGNLALISVSSNSSYNHQKVDDKRMDFIKRTKNTGIESLKLLAVYAEKDWTIEQMNVHQDEMYCILESAYNKPNAQPN